MTYRIKDWEKFETADSRRRSTLHWVAIPNKHDGKGFRRLMRLPNAGEIFGGWCLILQVASKMPVRGILTDSDGPLTAEDIADKVGCSTELIQKALDVTSSPSIGWVVAEPCDSTRIHTEPCDSTPKTAYITLQDNTKQQQNNTLEIGSDSEIESASERTDGRPPVASDWPLTARAIRQGAAIPNAPPMWPTAADEFVLRVVRACQAAAGPKALDDETLADAVATAARASPGQRKHGLFLTSVPEVIKTWANL